MEQSIQGHDSNAIAGERLCRRELKDDVFQSPDAGVKLPDNMDDEHPSLEACTDGHRVP